MSPDTPRLCALRIADPPLVWERLGFAVQDRRAALGGVYVCLGEPGRGIVGWSVAGLEAAPPLAGLEAAPPLAGLEAAPPLAGPEQEDGGVEVLPSAHPNGATAIDHVVLVTPEFDRTAAELEQAGMALRRQTTSRHGARQGFRRLGPTILELVEAPQASEPRMWGLTLVVEDLDALAVRLGEQLGAVRDAVQPGRRIATLRSSAGLSGAVAFMDPPAP